MVLCKDRSFYRSAIRMTAFIALQNGIVCLVGLIDNIMIGAWSQDALSGIALANQIQFLLQMVVNGVGEGMAVLTAQYWGTHRLEPMRKIIGIALTFAFVLACLFFTVAQAMPVTVLGWLSSDAAAVAEGSAYMRIVSFSYVFFAWSMVLNAAQRSSENVHIGMISSACAVLVNVVLNWMLIFGKGPFPAMGARGAALATLIARIIEFGVLLIYTYRIDRKLAVTAVEWRAGLREYLKDFIHVAVPVCCSGANWGIATSVQTAILGHMGAAAIAANSIAGSLFQLISVAMYGMAGASGVLIAKAVGRDDLQNLKGYVNSLQLMFLCCGILTGLTLFATRGLVLSLYTVTDEALQMAKDFILVLCFTSVGSAYQCSCLTGIVRGGGNTGFVFRNDLIFQWLVVIPLSLLSAFVWHLAPVWVFLCLKSDQVLKCFVAIPVVNRYRWVKKVTR